MADPVNLADVLDRQSSCWCLDGEAVERAILAYGGGGPVVVMPDGTLRRLTSDGVGYGKFDLIDSVAPDA